MAWPTGRKTSTPTWRVCVWQGRGGRGRTFSLGLEEQVDAGQRGLEGDLLGGAVPVEIGRPVAKVAGQWLLADDELVARQPGDRDRLMGDRRHADVDHVDLVDQGLQPVEETEAPRLGVGLSSLLIEAVHPDPLHVGPINLLDGLEMKRGGKAGADDARADRFLHTWSTFSHQ